MGKVKGKHRLDKYYHLAKEHGYRSRAAWKLVQLESKYTFLRSSQAVLDLCAAPGGWMQVAVERIPVGSLVIGVDLDPIRPIRGAIGIQEDITTPKCRSTIKKLLAENGRRAFDLVLHDGSPNVGGAWAKEATSQNALVIDSVKLAAEFLAPKGTFITKVFRSQDYSAVLYCLRQLFEKVEVEKPLASRSASAEIYILGFKYKAPAKIDPRLLDVKHLFQGGQEPPKVVDVLRGTKQKRHRDGYEDGATVLWKVCSASDFVWSSSPLDILGSVTSITFEDPASLPIRDHALTTEEVKALCDDLGVLGKQDFKHILRWRMQIRKALSPEKLSTPTAVVESESKEDKDERILDELEEIRNTKERKDKRKKKKDQAKLRVKEKARNALGIQIDATADSYGDADLFSLASIKGKKDLVAVDNDEYDEETAEVGDESDESDGEAQEDTDSDLDSEEERRRLDEHIEALFDEAHERYLVRVEGRTMQKKRSKQAYLEDGQLLQDGDDDSMTRPAQDSDSDKEDNEVNPLVVPLEDAPTQEEIVKKWFTQDVFAEPEEQDILDKYDSDNDMLIDEAGEEAPKSKKKTNDKQQGETLGQTKKTNDGLQVPTSKTTDDFEIVPAPATDSSDSSSDESDVDNAEVLATAKKLVMAGKRKRLEVEDDGYHKNMFHDEGLPKWFIDEEKKHRQLIKPVTKEEVAAMRAQFKAIDARPAKKVAQAKARKKRVAQRNLEKIRKKANTISDQADINESSKRKMIDKLYKKATPKRPERELVVAKKGVQVKVGKGKVLVDPRMKKDARKSKGKKGKQKGKGSGKASAAAGGKNGGKSGNRRK